MTWWFGETWGAAVCIPASHAPTPVGVRCSSCEKPISENERGIITPAPRAIATFNVHYGRGIGIEALDSQWARSRLSSGEGEPIPAVAYHLDCFLRAVLGPNAKLPFDTPERENPPEDARPSP